VASPPPSGRRGWIFAEGHGEAGLRTGRRVAPRARRARAALAATLAGR